MSRTDKTDPFWVKVQRYGVEDHDHRHLGKEVWHSRPVRDDEGNIVREEAPLYREAKDILTPEDRKDFWYRSYRRYFNEDHTRIYYHTTSDMLTERPINWVLDAARKAVAEGDPKRLVLTGTFSRVKRERYLAYTVPDHCTINEEPLKGEARPYGARPCGLEADWYGLNRNTYRCNCSMCRGTDPSYERSRRRNGRDELRKVTKLANSGAEDWEDGYNELKMTTPLRYNMEWC